MCSICCFHPAAGGSKLADVSFDGWGDKAETPGTAVTAKTRGSNRVSFAVGVAEAGEFVLTHQRACLPVHAMTFTSSSTCAVPKQLDAAIDTCPTLASMQYKVCAQLLNTPLIRMPSFCHTQKSSLIVPDFLAFVQPTRLS
jgi:hypothetical protein